MAAAAAAVVAICVYAVAVVTDAGASGSDPAPVARKQKQRPSPNAATGGLGSGARRRAWVPRSSVLESAPETPAEPIADSPSREQRIVEANKRAVDQENAFLAQFRSESTDTTFANTWESRLDDHVEKRLGALTGFRDLEVECRSERCLAEATWDTFETATAALEEAADVTRGECATSVFMPEPEDRSGTYAYKIRFNRCSASE